MGESKQKVAAVDGWYREDAEGPRLIGTQCGDCGSYFFPRENYFCRNPECLGRDLKETLISRRGRLWSFTHAGYAPPPPYVAAEPFEPFAIAAVELEREKMVVLGQVVRGVSTEELEVGMEMELVLGRLYEDDEKEYQTWMWRPAEI